MRPGLPQKSNGRRRSAKGAKYESQGQALSAARRVAPGLGPGKRRALKVRNMVGSYSALSELDGYLRVAQGRRASLRSALAPGYHISRRWRSHIVF